MSFDYNRYMYARGNPLRYNDPTGHCAGEGMAIRFEVPPSVCDLVSTEGSQLAQNVVQVVSQYGAPVSQWIASNAADVSELGNWIFSPNAGDQASQNAGQNAGNSSNGAPNDFDPNKIPKGFESAEQFKGFSAKLYTGLEKAGYNDAQAAFQGSSVTGVKYTTGMPFDIGRTSDYDLALSGQKLMQAAQNIGVQLRQGGMRTGPLNDRQLEQLGLTNLANELSNLVGRPVVFMIYRSIEEAVNRGPSIIVPK